MKISKFKSVIWENKQRGGAALLLFICVVGLVGASGAAQGGSHTRVTGLQLSDTPEGSRVSVVSDKALGDYEAFRRGDRFYVKIPTADLATSVPTFRAAGFEDMLVQRQGDAVIVSFKLQPGASARVDLRGNRLDVLFSSPNRTLVTGANTSGYKGAVTTSQTVRDRGIDGAGPVPPGTVASSRLEPVQTATADENRFSQGGRSQTSQRGNTNKNPKPGQLDQATTSSPAPGSSPTSLLSPGSPTNYSSLGTASPAPSVTSESSTNGSSGSAIWRNRFATAKQWIAANRLASLLGALILLSLIAYLVLAIRGRKEGYKEKSAKTPKVQPKFSAGEELKEVSSAKPVVAEKEVAYQPVAQSAAAAAHRQPALTKPNLGSAQVSEEELSSEQEDREVFEL